MKLLQCRSFWFKWHVRICLSRQSQNRSLLDTTFEPILYYLDNGRSLTSKLSHLPISHEKTNNIDEEIFFPLMSQIQITLYCK